jgi:[ribosomal protein S5]-alanine N-acetyltransferase
MIIQTKEFILRPIKLEDVKPYFESMSDKTSKKGFPKVPETLEEAKKGLNEKIKKSKEKKPRSETFVIEINGKYAGFVEINDLNKGYFEHRGNIGYCIHPNYRGKGLATQAVRLLVGYAFKKYGLIRIEGWCRTFNKASARVMEKAGFKLEGILRKNKYVNGKYVDDMIWAKVK